MAEEQKMPETQAGTQPNGQQPAQEAPQPAADAPHSCPEEGSGQETTKEHKEHKPARKPCTRSWLLRSKSGRPFRTAGTGERHADAHGGGI